MRILILGGTSEARALAGALVEAGHAVTTSLAGRTSDPKLPDGGLRVGGFGGIPGLCAYLRAGSFDYLVDATHPYAGLISINAVAASQSTGIPLLRLLRPEWPEPADAPWLRVASTEAAAALLPSGARALLSTGHTGLKTFLERDDCTFLVRVIEPPAEAMPAHANLLLDRPPYTLAGETALMQREAVTHLVSKNSGGSQTTAKLDAARDLGIAVVMIDRPAYGPAHEVGSVEEALAALHSEASRR
ncbi:cobalt-precorrin-6A reductase [Devosia sp. D6-9]|nr:cobalt-precorrin-6A reductase [Devosia sp. D6-9]